MKLGEPDDTGRRRPIPLDGSVFTLPAHTAVKAIGQQPRDQIAEWIDGLELDRGKVKVAESGRTGNPKFFCGGDAINGGASVVEAVRDGKRAAQAIDRELRCRS
jgi:glutamate synthase (NADPH/NADH) small chain